MTAGRTRRTPALVQPPALLTQPTTPFGDSAAAKRFCEIAIVGWEASRRILAEPVSWCWEGRIAIDNVTEVSGPSGVGKSTIAFGMVVARANPTKTPVTFLGAAVHPAGEGQYVVAIFEENGRRSAVAAIDRFIQIFDLPPEATWARIILLSRAGVRARAVDENEVRHAHLTDPWAFVHFLAAQGLVALVVIDTRARVLNFGSAKEEEAQAAAAEVVQHLGSLARCPVIIISHTRKGGGGGIEDVSGSGQRGAAADVVLMVEAIRNKDAAVTGSKLTFAKLRDVVDEHPPALTYAIAKDADGRWHLTMNGGATEEVQLPHEKVAAHLALHGPMTKSALKNALKMSGTAIETAISTLFAERRLTKATSLERGQRCVKFTVKQTANEILKQGAPGLLVSVNAPEDEEDADGPF